MFLSSNIKYLRTQYVNLTQAEFGKLFILSRSNVESYERGIAKPKPDKIADIAKHFNISIEVLLYENLKVNPGVLFKNAGGHEQLSSAVEFALKAKDETIKELKAQVKNLQEQNSKLIDKLGNE